MATKDELEGMISGINGVITTSGTAPCISAYMAPSPWENPPIPFQPLVVPTPNVTVMTAPDPRIDSLLTTLAALVTEVQRLAGLIEKKRNKR